jgi:hypothetical protein
MMTLHRGLDLSLLQFKNRLELPPGLGLCDAREGETRTHLFRMENAGCGKIRSASA